MESPLVAIDSVTNCLMRTHLLRAGYKWTCHEWRVLHSYGPIGYFVVRCNSTQLTCSVQINLLLCVLVRLCMCKWVHSFTLTWVLMTFAVLRSKAQDAYCGNWKYIFFNFIAKNPVTHTHTSHNNISAAKIWMEKFNLFLNRSVRWARRSKRFSFYLYLHHIVCIRRTDSWASPQSKIRAQRLKYPILWHRDGVSKTYFFSFIFVHFMNLVWVDASSETRTNTTEWEKWQQMNRWNDVQVIPSNVCERAARDTVEKWNWRKV